MKYVLILLLFGVIFLAGCISQSPTGKVIGTQACPESCDDKNQCTKDYCNNETSYNCKHDPITPCCGNQQCESGETYITCLSDCPKPKVSTKEPSQIVLGLSDLPTGQNWTMKSRVERVKSDIDKDAQSLGWKGGYEVSFMRIGSGQEIFGIPTDMSLLNQLISIYPTENISKVLSSAHELLIKNFTVDELSKPNIGDDSRAFRLKEIDEYGNEDVYYSIIFIKMDVLENIILSGLTLDYELLKDVAKKAESKIS